MINKAIIVSGYFNPLHKGHIEYFKSAKQLSNYLIVGLNSNEWLIRKKQVYFMSWLERAEIIKNLSIVDEVIAFNDDDETAADAISIVLLQQAKIDGVKVFELIDTMKKYETNQLSELVTEILNHNRLNTSVLGIKKENTQTTIENRNIHL